MNKEELIGKLQMVYVGDKNALNEMIDYYDELFDEMSNWREEENKKYKNQQKEFIEYLENEKDRLVRWCSNVYEDGLGRTRLVNEDIFDEIDNILQKYREIIGE